jgi:hypothetical protein
MQMAQVCAQVCLQPHIHRDFPLKPEDPLKTNISKSKELFVGGMGCKTAHATHKKQPD